MRKQDCNLYTYSNLASGTTFTPRSHWSERPSGNALVSNFVWTFSTGAIISQRSSARAAARTDSRKAPVVTKQRSSIINGSLRDKPDGDLDPDLQPLTVSQIWPTAEPQPNWH